MIMRQIVPSLQRLLSTRIRLTQVSTRSAVTCVFSKETVNEEPQWVQRRVADAKLWWYRSSKDRLPCPDGSDCQKPQCKLLHPICVLKNCPDKYCRYSHQSRAKNKGIKKEQEKIVLVGD
ncbi:RNA polymerase III subunit [Perkinsela sp. CCAP 1560/4]|nr:RNA polymerase III subunit [Perkinsela sp. CCAP 1560/4]|eukprot:KNH01788.1 RNA polymerase III subunit [Perkinsela sp. CCAP 1560/4]